MKKSIVIIYLITCWPGFAVAAQNCPVCKGKVVDTRSLKDDISKPSLNIAVWNRSNCGNLFYHKGSLICPAGGYAYEPSFKTWNLSLNDKDGFKHPLLKTVYSFPLPVKANIKSGLVYSQEFSSLSKVKHSLLFWCSTDSAYFKKSQEYANVNKLVLTIEKERLKGQSIVSVTNK
jgi:hypothetical protein